MTLEEKLEALIETLRQGAITVEDFHADGGREVLGRRLNDVAEQLSALEDCCGCEEEGSSCFEDVEVPIEVVAHVDRGRNPELYSRGMLEATLAHNQKTRAKLAALRRLHEALDAKLAAVYPEEHAAEKQAPPQSQQQQQTQQ